MTQQDLINNGFELNDDNSFSHAQKKSYKFTLTDNAITHVRQNQNYHGIFLSPIESILDLKFFIRRYLK